MITETKPIMDVQNLSKFFPIHGGVLFRHVGNVHAVDQISFKIFEGETLGLVGESGCGKSTLGRTILNLYKPTSGNVIFNGHSINQLRAKELRSLRREMQIILQDPMESLNPRMTVGSILEEPFIIHKKSLNLKHHKNRREMVQQLLLSVGLQESAIDKYPHEFSGGQRQRIGIARAIALKPKLIICDEPVSALDVSVQSQILNLLVDLQKKLSLTYIFIAHNLAVVKYIADRIAVMYLGRIVELAASEDLYQTPSHPYTQALISAIPEPDPLAKKNIQVLEGDVPSPISPPSGCHFHPRCPYAKDICRMTSPKLRLLGSDSAKEHWVSCHFAGSLSNA